jgi:hypothetical protein
MIHLLHGYLAAAIIKPDIHAISLCYGVRTLHDCTLLLCNTVAPGKDGKRVPAVQRSIYFLKKKTFAFETV